MPISNRTQLLQLSMKGNLITSTTELAMQITLAYVSRGDTVVDATCGTGHDTAVLASSAGSEGIVYAFDIQKAAIEQTAERLDELGIAYSCGSQASGVVLINGSFTDMGSYVRESSVSAVVFNLGYLPGGDHNITTKADATLQGLETAVRMVKPGGIVTVVLYDGHEEGKKEKAAVLKWAEELDPGKYHAAYVSLINQKNAPPEILWVTRKK